VYDLELAGNTLYATGLFKSILASPHSAVAGIVDGTVDVATPGAIAGLALRAAPNPASAAQSITFSLPRAGNARVGVYDVAGRLVRQLADGPHAAGDHRVEWDGRSDVGVRARAGIFFARVEAERAQAVTRLVRIQ
jgi:hypothetical protein